MVQNNYHTRIPILLIIVSILFLHSQRYILASDNFIKINDQIIPIDFSLFSSEKSILSYTSAKNYYPSIENINLCQDDNSELFTVCDKTKTISKKTILQRKTTFKLNKVALKDYLEQLNQSIKKSPKNATFRADADDKIVVIKKEENGYELDIEKIMLNIPKYFNNISSNNIPSLPIKITTPKITSTNFKEIGLKEKIASGQSNFIGSPKNRIHNIHVATSKFEGVIIAPGEKFSFIKNLGEVDEESGYKEELVIKNHKTIPEFGGGICQVSTTLFRSAVKAGLEISERHNHAYPVQYYSPQGTDATVYIPKPDLQFINNTPSYILIQPHFKGTILIFDIFGTKDGRQVEMEGPHLIEQTPDGGKKYVWWQIIKDRDGNQISKKGFWSFYHNAASYHNNHAEQILTIKPKNWSNKEWKKYKREHKF